MHNIPIYAAPSLSLVIDQLSVYSSTGMLTIWRAADTRQEATRITIELGRPLRMYRGSYWENVTESTLAWINTWGEIHFSFQPTEVRLQLPAPPPSANGHSSPQPVSEKTIATLTPFGRTFAAANLPRYDRTIFLLINGRRTVSDLSQLIKRSPEEIYTTLQRLQNQQLITFETLAPQP